MPSAGSALPPREQSKAPTAAAASQDAPTTHTEGLDSWEITLLHAACKRPGTNSPPPVNDPCACRNTKARGPTRCRTASPSASRTRRHSPESSGRTDRAPPSGKRRNRRAGDRGRLAQAPAREKPCRNNRGKQSGSHSVSCSPPCRRQAKQTQARRRWGEQTANHRHRDSYSPRARIGRALRTATTGRHGTARFGPTHRMRAPTNAADDLPRAATQTFGEARAGTHDGGHSLGGLFSSSSSSSHASPTIAAPASAPCERCPNGASSHRRTARRIRTGLPDRSPTRRRRLRPPSSPTSPRAREGMTISASSIAR